MATIITKFKSHLPEIWGAIDGDIDLRSANQKLYKKIYKYYKHTGAIFTGDSDSDYNLIIRYLGDELY